MVPLSLDFGNSDPTSTNLDPGTAEMWHGTQGVGGTFIDREDEEDDDDVTGVAREANSGEKECGDNEEALVGEIAWHVFDAVDEEERCLRFEGAEGEASLSRTRCFPFRSSLCCPCSFSNVRASVAALMKVSSSKAACSTVSMISPSISCLSRVSISGLYAHRHHTHPLTTGALQNGQNGQNGAKWCKTGAKQCKTVQNGAKWVQNGCKMDANRLNGQKLRWGNGGRMVGLWWMTT